MIQVWVKYSMGIHQRRSLKVGLSATIDLDHMRKLEDISITRRAKLSPIVNEVIGLGLEEYDKRIDAVKFKQDLEAAKELERIRKAAMGGQA